MNAAGTGVQFQCPLNGGKTSANTKYPRCELREYATGSTTTKAAWSGSSGRHIMRGKSKVMHYGPIKCETVVAQIHDASDDTLQIRAEAASATGAQTWRLSINGTEVKDLISGVVLGQEVAWDIDVNNGSLTVKINGTTQYGPVNPGWGAGQYFKAGCYAQQNTTDQANPSSEYSRIELRDLFVSHS
jgi:poly(beta-D-mannuronate) lyase